MRRFKLLLVFICAIFTAAVSPAAVHASHTGGDITLRDINGISVANSTKAYSPRRTCGVTDCHAAVADRYGLMNNIYEDTIAFSIKDHGLGSPSYGNPYQVPYALHGVSAGYHFQQGRNITWNDSQRTFYGLPAFTSSPGMFGKY